MAIDDLQREWADEVFGLTSGEEEARARFDALAADTFAYFAGTGLRVRHAFEPCPESAFNPACFWRPGEEVRQLWGRPLPSDLARRWEEWADEYLALRERNPRLALRDALQDVSESHDASSWPEGYEDLVLAWVDAGDASAPPPFDDRNDVATPEFFARLTRLRDQAAGWLFRDAASCTVRFVPFPLARAIGEDRAASRTR